MAEITVDPITVDKLTEAKISGSGVFDVLMSSTNVQVLQEFDKGRIKGQDYAQVYLGSMQAAMQTSLQFLLQKDQNYLQAALIAQQVELAKVQLQIAEAELARQDLQTELLQAQVDKLKADTTNAITQNDQILAEICLLKAQYDVAMIQKLNITAQTSLVQQKIATEKAQTVETGVDDNSVVGKQKLLYAAQTAGFARDAEQKAAKILVDTWNVRRTTDDGTVADETNLLDDATIGRAMTALLAGVNA